MADGLTEDQVYAGMEALFNSIEDTATECNGLSLQMGRIWFDGSFDAKAAVRACYKAALRTTSGTSKTGKPADPPPNKKG